jgi:hypothetical protein
MNLPIKNDPNDKIVRENHRVRRHEPKEDKFQEEMNSTQSIPKLKKHTRSLDSETDEDLGKIRDENGNEQVSLFDLSASTSKKKNVPAFVPEQAEKMAQTVQGMAYPDPNQLMGSLAQSKIEKGTPESLSKLQEIVEKIIAEVQRMELKGKTDTIVTLNHPPLLKGANLVMTAFDSAKGELNIAFENLSQRAKTFLDSNNHLDLLKLHLEQKGYITHIITTTTLTETKVFTQAQPQPHKGDEREQQQQQQRQNQEQEEDDKQ